MDWAVARNELARAALRASVIACGHLFAFGQRRQIVGFAAAQERLRRRYGIADDTPIRSWGAEVEASIERFAAAHADARFAFTSGSTSRPKRVAFTRARLRRIKRGSFSVAARLYARHPGCRAGLFILSSLKSDDSLTSLLLDDEAGWLDGLIMPARHLRARALAPILEAYGATAARLWLMVLADPGILYSTNPSTLALFLRELEDAWPVATRLIREHTTLEPQVQRVAAQLASPGWRERFARIATATAPLPIAEILPGLAVYCTWDGGYVRPFLDQLRPRLGHARFIPMYSMSTETVETLTHYDGDEVRFLPLAPGVLYEFLPDDCEDLPAHLVPARDVTPGRAYSMVVSDPYGLVRYQTDDLFECRGKVGDVPDLAFLRRRGLSYSFTGEKLTDRQVSEAFGALFAETPALAEAGVQLTCIPSHADPAALPAYRLVLAHTGARAPAAEPARVAARFDEHLSRINREFATKLGSGRLGPTSAVVMSYDALAARLDGKGDVARRSWDSQFKLLPLYRRTWESFLDLRDVEVVSWDVDGTLYPRARMIRALALRGLLHPLAALRAIWPLERFRRQMQRARRAGGRLPAPVTRDRAVEAQWYGPAIARAGVRPGVRELCAHFQSRGLRQIVLSDYHADYKLEALGLGGAFDAVYAGEALGFLKPAVELFAAVTRAVAVPPERILHIGDRADTDGAAVQLGWRVVILGRDVAEPADLLTALT